MVLEVPGSTKQVKDNKDSHQGSCEPILTYQRVNTVSAKHGGGRGGRGGGCGGCGRQRTAVWRLREIFLRLFARFLMFSHVLNVFGPFRTFLDVLNVLGRFMVISYALD